MLKLNSLWKRGNKFNSHQNQPENQNSGLQEKQAFDFSKLKELDKKLIYSLNKKKLPSLKQLKYLPKVLDKKENRIISGLMALIFACLILLGITFFEKNFIKLPDFGGEYTEALIGTPQYINPLLSQTNDIDSDITRLVFSGLLKYDYDLKIVTDLASEWHESEDKKEYTFILKDDLKWSDGVALTVDDIIFTIQSIKDPDFKSPLLISFRGIETEKIDEKTIKFKLPDVYPAFLEVLTFGILPEHIWANIPAINANLTEYNLKPVGNGPWKFDKLTKDKLGNIKSYEIVPNPYYPDKMPYLEKITFKFYYDFQTAISALKNNSVEGISFLPKDLKSNLTGKKNIKFNSLSLPQYTAIFFNQKQNEILKEKDIRKALALSIDKSKLLADALSLEGQIIDGPILPVEIQIDSEKKLGFDLDLANQILEESGWIKISKEEYQNIIDQKKIQAEEEKKEAEEEKKEDNENSLAKSPKEPGSEETTTTTADIKKEEVADPEMLTQEFYRKKGENILELTLTTVNHPENSKAASIIKESWEKAGIKVNLHIVETSKIGREIIKPRNYQILLSGIIVGSNPDPFPFWHSSQIQDPGLNLAMMANREVDKILEEAKEISDQEVLREKYQRFQEILTSEIPAIFLYHPTYSYVFSEKIKGFNISQIILPADRFNNLSSWYIKTKRAWRGFTGTFLQP